MTDYCEKKYKCSKKRVICIFLILALVCTFGFISYRTEYNKQYRRSVTLLSGYNNELCNFIQQKSEFVNDYKNMLKLHYEARIKMAFYSIEHLSEDYLSKVDEKTKAEDFFYDLYIIDFDKKLIFSKSVKDLELTDNQLDTLLQEKFLEVSGNYYFVEELYDGYYIYRLHTDKSYLDTIDLSFSGNGSYYVSDAKTGDVLFSNIPGFDNNLDSMIGHTSSFSIIDENGQTLVYSVYYKGIEYICAEKEVNIDDRALVVCSVMTSQEAKQEAFFYTVLAEGMLCLFILFVYITIINLKKGLPGNSAQENVLKIGKNFKCDRFYAKAVCNTVTIIGIAILFVSLFVHTLNEVVDFDNSSDKALSNISKTLEHYKTNSETMYQATYKCGIDLTNDVAKSLVLNLEDKNLVVKNYAETFEAEEINVYDENGVIEYTTSLYKGYSLSKNEKDSEYQLWSIINGSAREICVLDEKNHEAVFAVRRHDKVGMVSVKLNILSTSQLINKLDFSTLMRLESYDKADKLYSMRTNPNVLYIIKNGSASEIQTYNNLPMTEPGKEFLGIRNVNDKRYIVSNVGADSAVAMFAYPTTELVADGAKYLIFNIVAFFAAFAIAMFEEGAVVCSESATVKASMEKEKKKITSLCFPIAVTFATFLTVLILVIESKPFTFYFSGNKWERSLNIISLSSTMFVLGIYIGVFFLLSLVNMLISKYVSSKGATILSLIFSALKAVLIISFIANTLERFGVNTKAITAGLGLTGLAIGIGAKELINDLLAGIFIIFEGQIQVGDYIEVGSFYGKVTELGIRTTRVSLYNQEVIINNSNLKDVINNSRGNTVAFVQLVLPFSTPTEKINEVIKSASNALLQDKDSKLLGEVTYLGVSEATELGKKCDFIAPVAEGNKKSMRRKCYAELINQFEANGIHIKSKTQISVDNQ